MRAMAQPKIVIIFKVSTMKKFVPVAMTETGAKTNMAWYNDYTEETSKLVFASDISEIMGCSEKDLDDYDSLSDMDGDTRPAGNYSFSETPVFDEI